MQISRFSSILLFSSVLCANEGMWTFDNPPLQQMKGNYQFTPGAAWLDHLRLSSVRVGGASGSFISAHGLLLTNHHVARRQLQSNSSAEHNYLRDGFYASTQDAEMKSPDLEVNVLVSMENVTARVEQAVKHAASPDEQFKARRAVIAEIGRESEKATGLRSDVVTLYQGGEYWLYRYKRYTDVRLVFAPEEQIAFYGGDPDNFTYPRYDLDMAIFRVYENGKPIEVKDYLKWNPLGAKDGDMVFVSGHPAATRRLSTVAQLTHERDVALPAMIKILKDEIATLERYSAQGQEPARQAVSEIFGRANSLKANEGRLKGLLDPEVMKLKQREEDDFRARVKANPQWEAQYGKAWDEIAAAMRKSEQRSKLEFRVANSTLATNARTIVEYVAEIKKPDGQRLPAYHDARLRSLNVRLFSPAPIYAAMETAKLAGSLELALKELGPNDPFVKIVLNGKTPQEAAAALVRGTKLADPAERRKLIDGGEAAVAASQDSMIVLARKLDPLRREETRWLEENVDTVEQRASELLGQARFAAYGKNIYPDATGTLRLSYGAVAGYPMNGTKAPARTSFYGLYDRAVSFNFDGPFALPSRYQEGRDKLSLATPLNFVTTNDIIGGNSGSPVVNRAGEVVGLIFDGNIESLVGDYVYDGTANRAVAVTTNAMTEALRKLYGAGKLVDEIMR